MSRSVPSKSSPIDLNDKHDKADELGTLIVVLLKARNLNDKHSFRKSDVFAQAILNGVQKRTHVEFKGGQHPEWDGEARFPILKHTGEKYRKMEVACYSMEPRSEDLMGKATVDITETLKTGEFDDWVQLEVDGVARGEIYLEMTYYANAPAPAALNNKLLTPLINQNAGLTRRPSKLSPAERLSRPQQQHNSPINQRPIQEYPQQRPQGSTAFSFVPTHSSRLSEGKNTVQPDAANMPGSYTDQSNVSHRRTSDALPNTPSSDPRPQAGIHVIQHSAAPLPAILRPGQGTTPSPSGSSQRPGNGPNQIRHSSEPYLQSGVDTSQNSPPSYNPYLGVGGAPSTSVSQPPSPPQKAQGFLPSNSVNPYLTGTSTPIPGQASPHGHSPVGSIRPLSTAPPQNIAGPAIASPPYTQDPYSGYRLGVQQGGGAPLLWQQDSAGNAALSNGTFSFPTPNILAYNDNAQSAYNRRPTRSPPQHSRINSYDRPNPSRDDKFDPYLQARYQSPLPLPPGERPTPANHTPQPELVQASRPYPKTSTPSITPPVVDNLRLETLRRAEEDAARRREQELKDLELALQLDMELNLAEERAAAH